MADHARRAVFLDRDGTIVEDPPPGFLHEPDKVRLFPGAADAIRRLNDGNWLVIVVSNQSGIARGLYDAAAYEAVQRRLGELLAQHGARIDAAYFCPHHPEFTGPCECRKPGVKLFRDAEAALGLNLRHSYWVGDRLSDVTPANALGGRGLLVETGRGAMQVGKARALGFTVVADLAAAVAAIERAAAVAR
ncbi:MAG TPA: HAD family hydrolase [Gemmatimonadales bacterium]|nr:HAD family hydrolase [Gemmatimonadales bacterium]